MPLHHGTPGVHEAFFDAADLHFGH
jgi:hypothetical protein